MAYFLRAQSTTEMETNSIYHADITEVRIVMEGSGKNIDEIEDEEFDYVETLDFRTNIDREDTLNWIRKNKYSDKEYANFMKEHPLEGLCGFLCNEDSDGEDWEERDFPTTNFKYLALYEGEYLCDLGDGDLFKPTRLVNILKEF